MPTTPDTLRQQFHSAKFLTFDDINGLTRVHLTTPACTATVFLQGAHLTAWQPTGEQPVIFFSRKSDLAPGKPLRGGVPVVFPWFAGDKKRDRIDGHPGPSHGFARIQDWTLQSAAMHGKDAELVFTLGATDISRSMGFDNFQLSLRFVFGHTLRAELTVRNQAQAPLDFEEAFHTYFYVTDLHEVTITGLEKTPFIDKVDHFTTKPAEGKPIAFAGSTDRVYLDTAGPYSLRDGAAHRTISLRKEGSNSTIVWNPYRELPDIAEWDWHNMVAIETANVEDSHITLASGAEKTMAMTVVVQRDRA